MTETIERYIERQIRKKLFIISQRFQEQLKIRVPVDSGRLRTSIKAKVTQGNEILVFMAEYWKDVEFGTAPHVIRPKNKKALKFKSGGKNVIVKKIQHPGTRPQPFVRSTIFIDLPKILKEVL